ncbi:MAG: glycosyltransferase family 4 protein [Anaerolineae bacterium]|nr:glycosyltransferase family 4 protein [Anaerolineae bacterium]
MPRLFVAAGIFHPEPGGPATYLYEVLPALLARGWNIHVVTYGDPDPAASPTPYPVTRIPRRALPLRRLDYARAARRELRQADVVYAHTIDLPLWGGAAPRVLKVVGDQAWERCVRRGWLPPGTDIDAFQTGHYGWPSAWQQASRRRQVAAMQGIIVPSQYLRQMVIGWGIAPEKVQVIYNALPPAPPDLPDAATARRQMGWPDAPTLLTAARLTPWKGVDAIISALPALPEVRLVVAGTGEDLPRLRALAAPLGERVQFVGRLPRERLLLAMRAADYFVLYSGYEGLSHVLLESLQAGTPIIVSARGGNLEVVRPEENGLSVPHPQPAALAAALQQAFQPGTRARLAAGTAAGLERFTFEHMVQQTDAALRSYL